jgi:diketogulonate reductase-like aldo/keto reductase
VCYDAVTNALRHGYRHVDTARAYGNEASVGRAVRDSGLAREDVFVTSKVPAEVKAYGETLESFDESMRELALDYVDLYLIHAPWPWAEMGKDCRAENAKVWSALERIYASGRARAIGVSNFEVDDLTSLLETASITPMVNQIQFFIGNTKEDVVSFCHSRNIVLEGFSPLATGRLLDNEAIIAMAARYGKSVAQISIRYVLQKEIAPLPKSTNEQRIAENADVDFDLADADMQVLDGITGTN